ncbi:MAG: P-loop NTPase fold protein [Chloroflexi bacterium]|nr:P-loop NTPase fold protein [Chloroflexota bacterium]
MTEQPEPADAPPALPALKIEERDPDPENPWGDDVLGRKEIADRLTGIVRGQEAPFVISVDGRWGTGKTFLLERWAQDLQNQGFEAIYFNAWEDDFNDDPLLAIVGQLSEHFTEGAPDEIARSVAHATLNIVVKRITGLKVDELTPERLLDDYRDQGETKRAVKEQLSQLGYRVRDDTGQPLVFIIDELDRCRPTFAIELLERVKHIFDVPNIVFVFGINRGELVKSLESVYGQIDAGTYLRRFFEMEFVLPAPDPVQYCRHLLNKYGLDSFLSNLSMSQGNFHFEDFGRIADALPFILGTMGLSLRDMEYCIRLLSLAARDLRPREPLYPELLTVLMAVKITNQDLYRRFVDGTARGADVINYMNTRRGSRDVSGRYRLPVAADGIHLFEAVLYSADGGGVVTRQIDALMNGWPMESPHYLAEHHLRLNQGRDIDKQQLMQLKANVEGRGPSNDPQALATLAQRIDMHDGFVRP